MSLSEIQRLIRLEELVKQRLGIADLSQFDSLASTRQGHTSLDYATGRRRPQYRAASTLQDFQAGHGWSATGTNVASSNMNDTSDFVRGSQSAKITSNSLGGSNQANIQKLAGTPLDLTNKAIRLTFKVDDVTHIQRLIFFVGTSSLANNFKWFIHTHSAVATNFVQSGEWVTVTLEWADVNATAAGTFTVTNGVPSVLSGFTDLRFQVLDDGLGQVTAHLQSVEVIPSTNQAFASGVVSVVFDDGNQSVWDYAKPKMDTLGYRGSMFTIQERIGQATFLTLAELKALQNYSGWEVGGHAYAQALHDNRYTSYSAEEVINDLSMLKAWLMENGFDSDSFAYPGGEYSATIDGVAIDDLVGRFFRTARSTIGGIANDNLESFPPAMPLRLRCQTGVSGFGTNTQLPANIVAAGGALDRTLNKGLWTILLFHKITTGAATTTVECSQTDFNTIMDGISSRSIPVLPVGDVMRTA